MKKPNPMTGLSPFPTKKKSFDSTWGSRASWAAILGVCIACSAALTAAMVLLMAPRQVRFLNVRAANLPDLRTAAFPGEVDVDASTPLLFVGAETFVLGTVGSVVAPRPGESVAVASRARWKEELTARARALPAMARALPSRAFVVAYDERGDDQGNMSLAREIAGFAAGLNADATRPIIILARVPSAPTAPAASRGVAPYGRAAH
jgi:hypothetical protein